MGFLRLGHAVAMNHTSPETLQASSFLDRAHFYPILFLVLVCSMRVHIRKIRLVFHFDPPDCAIVYRG